MKPQSGVSSSLSRLRERAGERARELRKNTTEAEARLWHHLRNRQLAGFKFRRQHPVGPFVADFACLEAHLIVGIDGGHHFELEAMAADAKRTIGPEKDGFAVLRFDNRQVLAETDAVLGSIHQWLLANGPHPNPLPQAGEGARPKDIP